MKVLLVEPDKILAGQYESFLEQKGFDVSVANDAQSAVLAADKSAPDIVVLEVFLPGHSGVEFLYEFRSYPEWQSIPVIIHSRVSKSSLGISNKTMRDLNITNVLYKSETPLAKLAQQLSKYLSEAKNTNL